MNERANQVSERGGGDWEKRFHAAWARLNDAAAMVALDLRVVNAHPERPPTADVYHGEPRLRSARRVGVLAGSFNPLTDAHIAIANAAATSLRLDVVLWAIAAVTIDKERTMRASVADRLAQLIAFAASGQRAAVALINRGLYVDQAQAVRALVQANAEVVLLVGYDKILQIFDPHYYTDRDAALEELFAVARLAVFPRADAGRRELAQLLTAPQNARFASHVSYIDLPIAFAHDSSTEVRTLAAHRHAAEERIRSRIPPEAAALAATGPYYAGPAQADAYRWRQRWLGALVAVPEALLVRLPNLDTLIARTTAQNTSGHRLRTWLAGATITDGAGRVAELERLLPIDSEDAK